MKEIIYNSHVYKIGLVSIFGSCENLIYLY